MFPNKKDTEKPQEIEIKNQPIEIILSKEKGEK